MNIVRTNFMDNLPLMQKAIRDAAYVSFDLEFSGVLASPLLRNSFLDSQQMRYWKQKENIARFIPLQLGLCTFKEEGDSYLAHPFNIYLFPFAMDGYLDKRFVFSSASISFLSDNGFDFNKTFQEGVFYLSHQDEAILKETKKLNDLRKDLRYRDKVVSHEMKAQYASMKPEIEKFLKSNDSEIEFNINFVKPKVVNYINEMAHKDFPKEKFYARYDTEIFFRRNKLFLVKGEEPQQEKEVEIDSVADYAGVRVLMDQISEQKTPIIVHNGLLDIFHLYDKLYYQLPENLLDFKQNFRKFFPTVYDTKYIINQSYHLFSKVNHLSELKNSYQQLVQLEPNIVISQETPNYNRPGEESTFEHEAGYDAMMTGSIFLKAKRSLNDEVSFFKNRLPLGSIKVPFNLEQTEDLYHGPDTQIFHLLILEHRLLPESEVKKYFLEQFGGPVEIYLSYGVNFEYFITFHKQEICDKLIAQLKEGKLISSIDNSQVVISEYEAYTQTLQRRAKHELQVKEKPNNILE